MIYGITALRNILAFRLFSETVGKAGRIGRVRPKQSPSATSVSEM